MKPYICYSCLFLCLSFFTGSISGKSSLGEYTEPIGIAGRADVCVGNTHRYEIFNIDLDDVLTISWAVVGGEIFSGQGTEYVEVLWTEPGESMVVLNAININNEPIYLEFSVQVRYLPEVSISELGTYCTNEPPLMISGNPQEETGYFVIQPYQIGAVQDNGNGTAIIDPSVMTPGEYSVSYLYAKANPEKKGEKIEGLIGEESTYLGFSVSMSSDGNVMAVGSPYGSSNKGKVQIFGWHNGGWTQLGNDLVGESVWDEFGWSVSLSDDGSRVAIGIPDYSGYEYEAGQVKVFDWDGSNWIQKGQTISGKGSRAQFGNTVCLSGDGLTMAVSGLGEIYGENIFSGHTIVYKLNEDAWEEQGDAFIGQNERDQLGASLSLSTNGKTLAIGIPYSDEDGDNAGKVQVFDWDGQSWNEKGLHLLGDRGNLFGYAISVSDSGNILAVGEPGYLLPGALSGRVQVFEWIDSRWEKRGFSMLGKENDRFGSSLSLSGDGSRIVVGSPSYDQSHFAQNVGKVSVYEWTAFGWRQIGSDLFGEEGSDNLGWAVSMASEKASFAVGSPAINNPTYSGNARCYDIIANCFNVATTGLTIIPSDTIDLLGHPTYCIDSKAPISIRLKTNRRGDFGDQGLGGTFGPLEPSFDPEVSFYSVKYTPPPDLTEEIEITYTANTLLQSCGLPASDTIMVIPVHSNNVGISQLEDHCQGEEEFTVMGFPTNDFGRFRISPDVDVGFTDHEDGTATVDPSDLLPGDYSLTYEYDGTYSRKGQNINGLHEYDYLGRAFALSQDGNKLAIGSAFHNVNDGGQVRVFDFIRNLWRFLGFDINGDSSFDQFGASVALSDNGERVAIGAPFSNNFGFTVGKVHVFDLVNGNWSRVGQKITASSSETEAGSSVSISGDGNFVAVGAPKDDSNGENAGQVKIYQLRNGRWEIFRQPINGKQAGEQFGTSIEFSENGNTIVIGAPYYYDAQKEKVGRVSVHRWVNDSWTQIGQDIIGEFSLEQSGWSVACSDNGESIVIGAPAIGDLQSGGKATVYTLQNNQWIQKGSDLTGTNDKDRFGYSVSMSNDGQRIAIGAPLNDQNGQNAGGVTVFDFDNEDWVQHGRIITGEEANDRAGEAVELSGDGFTIAIGAPFHNDFNERRGRVRVFSIGKACDSQVSSSFTIHPAENIVLSGDPNNCAGSANKYQLRVNTPVPGTLSDNGKGGMFSDFNPPYDPQISDYSVTYTLPDNPSSFTDFTFNATESNNNCPLANGSKRIKNLTTLPLDSALTNIGPDQYNICGTEIEIGNPNTLLHVLQQSWSFLQNPSGSGQIDHPNNEMVTLTGAFGGHYILERAISYPEYCPVRDTIQVSFSPDADLPGGMPDGVQDCVDVCLGGDDHVDPDGVGMPYDCDCDPFSKTDEFVQVSFVPVVDSVVAAFQVSSDLVIDPAETPQRIVFQAGNNIQLQPGFHARPGSSFRAFIEYCRDPLQVRDVRLSEAILPPPDLPKKVTGLHFLVQPTVAASEVQFILDNPFRQPISVNIVSQNGQIIRNFLEASILSAGMHTYRLRLDSFQPGMYFVQVRGRDSVVTKQMVVIR